MVTLDWLSVLSISGLILVMLTGIIAWFYFRDAGYRLVNRWQGKPQKNMADAEVQTRLDWLTEQKTAQETAPLGVTKRGVQDASHRQTDTKYQLKGYRKELESLAQNHSLSDEEIRDLFGTYQDVQALSDKRADCLKILLDIAAMEDHIQSMTTGMDVKAMQLVQTMEKSKQTDGHKDGHALSNESLNKTTQNCISAVRKNWKWLDEVMQCAHVHLANAASYHQFFHDVEEVDFWMNTALTRIHQTFNKNRLKGDTGDLSAMNGEMKDTLNAYLRWQSKVDDLLARARMLVPLHKRLTPTTDPFPAIALTDYKTDEISFKEGDRLTVLDNSNKGKWKVQNIRHQEAVVPAVIILIPGPSGIAVDAAGRLRIQLLNLWTTSLGNLGDQLIAFLQLVFRDLTEEEVEATRSMKREDKDALLKVLQQVEDALHGRLDESEEYVTLQKNIKKLKDILNEPDDPAKQASATTGTVVVQVKQLENLANRYQEFWTYCDTYRTGVDKVRDPKHILVCDKLGELNFKASAHFVRYWDTNISLTSEERGGQSDSSLTLFETPKEELGGKGVEEPEINRPEEHIEVEKEQITRKAAPKSSAGMGDYLDRLAGRAEAEQEMEEQWSSSTDLIHRSRREQMQTDEVRQSVEEVRHTYVIKSVVDPRTEKQISMQEAMDLGILDQASGKYVNIVTGHSISLNEAMAQGDILVEFVRQKQVRRTSSSYGLITLTTVIDPRPYTIVGVVDPQSEKQVKEEQAYDMGIMDRQDLSYRTKSGDTIPVHEAIEAGWVKVVYHDGEGDKEVEEETKTYAVSGVVDQVSKKKVSFAEACERGLLNRQKGLYVNNATGETMGVSEAIIKGLIKAKVVDEETSKLDIDPNNRMVIEKFSSAKDKVLKAVRVTKAFQMNNGGQ